MNKSFLAIILMVLTTIIYQFSSIKTSDTFPVYYLQEETPVNFTNTPTPFPPKIEKQDSYLEVRINSLEYMIDMQSQTYSATVSRWESNLNLILTIIGIVSVIIALFGFTAFKYWMKNQINEQYKKTASDELNSLVKQEMDKMRAEWDPKFAKLYDEYRKTIKGK